MNATEYTGGYGLGGHAGWLPTGAATNYMTLEYNASTGVCKIIDGGIIDSGSYSSADISWPSEEAEEIKERPKRKICWK